MLRKFEVPILGVVENMATFTSDCGKIYRPFGAGSVAQVLNVVDDPSVVDVALPISKDDRALLGPALDPLVNQLPPSKVVELPQLTWHERPHWGDKLFFAGRGHARRRGGAEVTPQRRRRAAGGHRGHSRVQRRRADGLNRVAARHGLRG